MKNNYTTEEVLELFEEFKNHLGNNMVVTVDHANIDNPVTNVTYKQSSVDDFIKEKRTVKNRVKAVV